MLGTTGLVVAAVAAAALGFARGPVAGAALARLVGVVTAVQAAHVVEELATGFHGRFPELLGLVPWSTGFFVTFNACWLGIWGLCVLALAAGRRVPSFPLWFLAIAGIANGLAHPVLALRAGGYFPGLVTSPVLGVAGWLLWRRLWNGAEA